MSKPLKLKKRDAQWINTRGHGGTNGEFIQFKFKTSDRDDGKMWMMKDITDFMRSMPQPLMPRSFEIWVTPGSLSVGVWAKDKNHIDILANHWKTFNPSIQAFKPPVYFPPIGPGSVVRVGRVRQLRNATHPIRFEFGYKQKDGRVSPVVHLLNNLPFMPDGSALVIQVMWRKHWYNWKMNTLTRTEFISRGYDQEAVDLKVKERDSYYVDIRLIEIHDDAKMLKENYTKRMGTAFHVWDFPSANRLVYDDLRGWGRRKILRFINAIQDRNIRLFPIKHIRKPHFSTDEVASLIHPPPPGADVPNLMVVKTKNYGATPSQLSQSKAMEVLLLKAKKEHEARNVQPTVAGGIHGRTKKLTASDLRELRKRQEAGGQR